MKTMLSTIVCGLVLGASTIVVADTNQADQQARLQALEQKLAAQQAEIQQLRAANGDSWLNERRTEEVKSLIRDVLSDADTRASLAEGGMTAGWRDNFFLASEDGNYLLRISGQVQSRYTYNQADQAVDDAVSFESEEEEDLADEEEGGFSVRRAKIRFDGHLFDPRFTYAVQINTAEGSEEGDSEDSESDFVFFGNSPSSSGSGNLFLEDAWFAYEFADGWQVKGGQFKAPFLREEAVDSKHQLAMERSLTADLFTLDFTQGVQIAYGGELADTPIRAAAMLNDGAYAANTAYDADVSDWAASARVEILLAGDWAQFDDFQAWSTNSTGVLIGAAASYEAGETGRDTNTYDVFRWTVDASVELPELLGLTLFGAVIGVSTDDNSDPALATDSDMWGLVGQVGLFIIPDRWDIYGRYEYFDLDEFGGLQDNEDFDDEVSIITVGTNYYFHKHAAKATLDVMWVLDRLPVTSNGQGLTAATDDDQFTIRAQFQFLF